MKNSLVFTILLSFGYAQSGVSNLEPKEILKIHKFFSNPKNRLVSNLGIETKYSWQHTSEFFPTAQIARDGAYTPLPKAIDKSIEKITFKKDKKSLTIKKYLDNYPVDAFMVVKGGEIVYERYNTMTPTSKHIWWSSGKVIGSTMLALLEAEGKVDINKPVSFYLEELRGSIWDSVKVKEALDMATGLDATEHDEPNHDSRTNLKQKWHKWATSVGMYPDIENKNYNPFDILKSQKRRFKPFEKFEYNSINTFVINRITEKVTKEPLNRYFSKRVWSKIGARNDAYVAVSPQGYSLFYGFMNSTLEDMARFGMVFTPSITKIAKKPILPKSVIKKLQTQTNKSMYDKGFMGQSMIKKFGEKNLSNHYQWDVIFADGDMYKSGFGGQGLYVSYNKDLVIVWFSTDLEGKGGQEAMARAVAKYFTNKD